MEKCTKIVSIIIPIIGSNVDIESCIRCIEKQSYPLDLIEVIIVDNNDRPCTALATYEKFYNFKILFESTPGSYIARNLGIVNSSGRYMFFTDGDCLPDSRWVEEGVKALEKNPIVGGDIEHVFKNPEQPFDLELYEKIFYFCPELTIKNENYATTSNLLIRRDVIDKIGMFEPILRSAGDREWCERAVENGYKIFFAKKCLIRHPTRAKWKSFLKRGVRIISGVAYLQFRDGGLGQKAFKTLSKYYTDPDKMKKWNLDWDFYYSLDSKKQKKVWLMFRVLNIFDLLIIYLSYKNYETMKKFTMVDRWRIFYQQPE